MLNENGVKTRAYGKIDKEVLIKALGENKTKTEAGRIAGSLAVKDKEVIGSVNDVLNNPRNPDIKKDILQRLEAHRDRIMEALEHKDLNSDPSGTLNLILCQTVDKIQLLKGDPTSRLDIMPRFVIDEVEDRIEPKPLQIEQK